LAPGEVAQDSPPYETLIEPGSESLRLHGALFRDFADADSTPEGLRAFLDEHADLGTPPTGLSVPKPGTAVFVFPYDYKGEGPDDRAILEKLMMKRCIRLWDMVRRDDRRGLARHIRRFDHPKEKLDWAHYCDFFYDSHPELPRHQQAPPPDIREKSKIFLGNTDPDQVMLANRGDLRPAARAYIMGVINNRLRDAMSVQVIESPGGKGRMELHYVPRDLLAALWVQFADEVTGGGESARCLICGRWFRRNKHKDRVYCGDTCNVRACRTRTRARTMMAEGKTLKQAARALKTRVAILEKLLEPKTRKGD
jgi:hypothetical protein